jgi:hypothetical protein
VRDSTIDKLLRVLSAADLTLRWRRVFGAWPSRKTLAALRKLDADIARKLFAEHANRRSYLRHFGARIPHAPRHTETPRA